MQRWYPTRGDQVRKSALLEPLSVRPCWKKGAVPQDMNDATIRLCKNKGDLSDCNSYRGIYLLSIVGTRLRAPHLPDYKHWLTAAYTPGFQRCFHHWHALHTRTNGKLFNVARLRAKTKVKTARDMLFTDNAALETNFDTAMQRLINKLARTC